MHAERKNKPHGSAKNWFGSGWGIDAEDQAQTALDELTGDALLTDVRLEKVLKIRKRLLEGAQRDLVLAFAGEVIRGE